MGCCLTTLLKHADRVKMVCIPQLINNNAPIISVDDRHKRPLESL
ncbi:alpha-L-arabinofuranosidase C-terminal domain-containing protein [Paenibacillus pseudetheri]|nr:alpha-L-arabinofuranosidase C-terminal domain-containing protein [Paenibacillus pseudetheri]